MTRVLAKKTRAKDRRDPTVARSIVESLLPDAEQRQGVLAAIAESIECVAKAGSRSWAVTLLPKLVRLNAGRAMVLDFRVQSRVTAVALREQIPEHIAERLERHRGGMGEFKVVPGSIVFSLPAADFLELWPEIRGAVFAFAERAAATAERTPYGRSHSSGVVDYLSTELGRGLPRCEHEQPVDTPAPEAAVAPEGSPWWEYYEELAQEVMERRERQEELLGLLRRCRDQGMKTVLLQDSSERSGAEFPLAEIDPFTFFASFNRGITDANRTDLLREIGGAFGLEGEPPVQFDGVPVVDNQQSWFFPFSDKREADMVRCLWRLAEAALEGGREAVDPDDFAQALTIPSVGMAKLTQGLYWIASEEFLPMDRRTRAYLRRRGLPHEAKTWEQYLEVVDAAEKRLGGEFRSICNLGWLEGESEGHARRYWAGGFQWGDGSRREEFLRSGRWRIGWPKDSEHASAKRCWSLIEQVRPGDLFALKGFGGKYVLKVHGLGEVVRVQPEEGALEVRRRDGVELYHGSGPRNAGAGAWMETLLEVTRDDVIELVFGPVIGEIHKKSTSPSTSTFAALLDSIRTSRLYFPEEVVASYLLALQAKRFVILTGISGTGKTQLARAVAVHFAGADSPAQPAEPTADPDDPHLRRVRPSMLKNGGFSLLAAFQHAEPEFIEEARERKTYPLRFLGEERMEARIWFRSLDDRPFVRIPTAYHERLRSSLEVGELLRLTVADSDGEVELRLDRAGSAPAPAAGERRHEVVSVRPDWTDNRGLLGFYNPLTRTYRATPFLRLLLAADEEVRLSAEEGRTPRPYFAILDEMNLARVEHYFSDFLSCMESSEPLHLHDDPLLAEDDEEGLAVPMQLRIPENVFFTGTVNVDETTFMFSPKVLDRAFTLEFDEVDLRGLGDLAAQGGDSPLALTEVPAELAGEREKPSAADWAEVARIGWSPAREALIELNDLLACDHRHFGYRVASEISRFLVLAAEQAGQKDRTRIAALDVALLAKVLPKLHGTQQELAPTLDRLFAFAVGRGEGETGAARDAWELRGGELERRDEPDAAAPDMPRSASKLWRMIGRLRQQGFTSFIE